MGDTELKCFSLLKFPCLLDHVMRKVITGIDKIFHGLSPCICLGISLRAEPADLVSLPFSQRKDPGMRLALNVVQQEKCHSRRAMVI
jgi:hypothetical protein